MNRDNIVVVGKMGYVFANVPGRDQIRISTYGNPVSVSLE